MNRQRTDQRRMMTENDPEQSTVEPSPITSSRITNRLKKPKTRHFRGATSLRFMILSRFSQEEFGEGEEERFSAKERRAHG